MDWNLSLTPPGGGDILSAIVDYVNASRERALREHLDAKNRDLQERIENERNRLQEKMNNLQLNQQKALAEADRELQVTLAQKNRKLQWEISLFTEYCQRQRALKEINQRFYTDNFPLYIRMENYCDLVPFGKAPAVKIVFSPPFIDGGDGRDHVLTGIDVLMTARMTGFLNELYGDENGINPFCEYVGNAWRNKQFRGQSAYRYIFNEFSSEPFMIVDCEVVRKYLTFQVCYWLPGDETYRICQVLDGIQIDPLLGKRVDGKREPDYDALIDVIISLSQISVGVMVDLYQMTSGELHAPRFLKKLPDIVAGLPGAGSLGSRVEQLAMRQYLRLADPDKENKTETEQYPELSAEDYGYSRIKRFQNSVAIIHTYLMLAKLLAEGDDISLAERYFLAAWEGWCLLFGISASDFQELYEQKNIRKIFLEELRNDSDMEEALLQMVSYRSEPYAANYFPMLDTLAGWFEEDVFSNPELYQIQLEKKTEVEVW